MYVNGSEVDDRIHVFRGIGTSGVAIMVFDWLKPTLGWGPFGTCTSGRANFEIAPGVRPELLICPAADFDFIEVHALGGNDEIILENGGTAPVTGIDATIYGYHYLYGWAGNDTLNAGVGGGELYGGTDSDTLNGTAWSVLYGESGDDTLNAGPGGAQMLAGAGNDVLNGSDTTDTMNGEDGRDTIHGNGGDDTIDGGVGPDTINGGSGSDAVQGGPDPDSISGGADGDTISGGGANDNTYGDGGDDVITGGSGADSLVGGDGNDSLAGGSEADGLWGGTGNDSISGDDGNDTLYGESGGDTMQGGTGTDLMYGGGDSDTLLGGADGDTIAGETGGDSIDGGPGSDLIDGGNDRDILAGGTENDTVYAGAGNDDVAAGPGNDWVSGDLGTDTLVGGDGDDTLGGGPDADILSGDAGTDSLDGGGGEDELRGGAAADQLRGGDDGDDLFGDDGDDLMYGDSGNDVLYWGAGGDLLDGGPHDDTLDFRGAPGPLSMTFDQIANDSTAGEHDNVVSSGDFLSRETVYGSNYNDTFIGDAYRQIFFGEGGDDTFTGFGGSDWFHGGPEAFTGDTVTYDDRRNPTPGTPPLPSLGVSVTPGNGANDGGPGELDDVFGDVENIRGGDGPDSIVGTDYTGGVAGSTGRNKLEGGFGDDRIWGRSGPDEIDGGPGDDFLYGDDGNDIVVGGLGVDYLEGGVFDHSADVLNAADGYDTNYSGYQPQPLGDTVQCGYDAGATPTNVDQAFVDIGADTTLGCLVVNGGRPADAAFGAEFVPPNYPGRFTVGLVGYLPGVPGALAIKWNGPTREQAEDALINLYKTGRQAGDEYIDRLIKNDQISVTTDPNGAVRVTDLALPIDPGAGCQRGASRREVVCGSVSSLDLDTGRGDDQIKIAAAVTATVRAGSGNDTIAEVSSASADQVLDGGTGDNTLRYARAAGTTVTVSFDGQANDGATGEHDNASNFSHFIGGPEDDTFVSSAGPQSFDGGAGSDTVSYATRTAAVSVRLPDPGATTSANGEAGENDELSNVENAMGGNGNDVLTGNDVANVLRGAGGDDRLSGRGGNDYLVGGYGGDDLYGDAGQDTISYEDHSQAVTADLEELATDPAVAANRDDGGTEDGARKDWTSETVEHLSGGSAGDTLLGNSSGNTLNGFSGNDLLKGRSGNDALLGGSADDTLEGEAGGDGLDGGSGNDFIDYSPRPGPVTISLDGIANDGEAGENDNVYGSAGIDTIRGTDANDSFTGDSGSTRFEGWGGNDRFRGGAGADEFAGGSGADRALYDDMTASVVVTLDGLPNDGVNAERDNVNLDVEEVAGGSANDLLYGNHENNLLMGNGGDDFLQGKGGGDDLSGGLGVDTVDYTDHIQSVTVSIGNDARDDGGAEDGLLKDMARSDNENITGTNGADVLSGNDRANRLLGRAGNDTLSGSGGNDVLDGSSGNDTLFGQNGDDSLDGGSGADSLDGGAGMDATTYQARTKKVRVTVGVGVDDGEDTNGDGTIDEGDDVKGNVENIIGGQWKNELFGNEVNNLLYAPTTRSGGDSLLYGNGGDDVLISFIGKDTLDGGAGNDLVLSGDNDDTVIGGSGVDDVDAGPGNDFLMMADGRVDTRLACNAGYDIVQPDYDTNGLRDAWGLDCEEFKLAGWDDRSESHGTLPNTGGDATSPSPNRIDAVFTTSGVTPTGGLRVMQRYRVCFLTCVWTSKDLGALPGTTVASDWVSIASRSANSLDVVAIGMNYRLYHKCTPCSPFGWSNWADITTDGTGLTVQPVSAPEITKFTINGTPALVVFVQGSDNAIYARLNIGGQWSPWRRGPGGLSTGRGVGAASITDGRVELVAVRADGKLYQTYFACGAYECDWGYGGVWTNVPGAPGVCECWWGDPDMVSSGPGRLDVILRGGNVRPGHGGVVLWWKPFRNGSWLAGRQLVLFGGEVNPGVASPNTGELYVMTADGGGNYIDLKYREPAGAPPT